MAKFKITKTTSVGKLKKQFADQIGGTLHVYDGRSQAEDDMTLVSLGAKTGELECRTSRTVGKFEEAFQEELNVKVKVYTVDDWVHVLSGVTLESVSKIKRQARKANMEQFVAYKREEGTVESSELKDESEQSQEEGSDTNEEETEVIKLKGLCDKIKEALENIGKDSFIIKSEKKFRVDGDWLMRDNYNILSEDLNEDIFDDVIDDYYYDDIINEYCVLCRYDCVDYAKQMSLNGVLIKDDELKFYLQEYREDDNGIDPYFEPFEVDFTGLIKGWWFEKRGNWGYDTESVLSKYLELITEVLPKLMD